ncbi:PorT family protein [Candidatus Kaistella beijingensis]|uniref:porin family protein n=1 Tax=Candidatus Kaistella beijingensis TaxID=2820270 RepID=UPI001CC785AD|nr:porin family protein [Candidatus Kaistella beijingensis]UBB90471.1 PorT family protein [Candidatus Kaistella beijingensis]
MKKLFLGAAIAMSSLTFAQQFGIKAGMNVSSLSKDASMDDAKSKIGFNAGVFMNAPLAENFSIQPELIYSQYGNKSTSTSTYTLGNSTITSKTTGSTNLDYLALPVMFQYKATPEFYLEAGPEFGMLLSGKVKGDTTTSTTTNGTTTTTSSSGSTDIKDNLNGFNFGVGLGAGYYFTPNVGINARYVAGFTDIAKNRPSGSDAIKNNVFQVGLNYKF